ncbi:MAG TPA: hypothetical protein VF054_08150 [Micromonosporaceae bacterium]
MSAESRPRRQQEGGSHGHGDDQGQRNAPRPQSTPDQSPHLADLYDLAHARAYAGPPCPGRGLWAITVLTCPHCRGMHQHRAGEAARLLAGRIRRCCPVTGLWYVLAPVQRRREAVRRVA